MKIIIELEERLRLAMLSSDVETLDTLISPDLIFTNHFGMLVSKQEDLHAHANKAFVFNSLELSESQINAYEHCAVVTVKADIQGYYLGEPANGCFRFTRVWAPTSGQWQLVAAHSSKLT